MIRKFNLNKIFRRIIKEKIQRLLITIENFRDSMKLIILLMWMIMLVEKKKKTNN